MSVPVNPRASHKLELAAAAVRQALICTPASAPVNRSAFCTWFSELTAAEPFTSRLYCGLVVLIPSELGVNRCAAASVEVTISVWPVGSAVIVALVVVAPETNVDPNCCGCQYAALCRSGEVEMFTQYPATGTKPAAGAVQLTLTALLLPESATPVLCTDCGD